MKTDSKKNPKPIAPVSAGTENASGLKFTSPTASPKGGKLIKKKGAQAGDPYAQPVGKRANKKATSKASYGGIKTMMSATIDPAAGLTQANGRVISQAARKQAPNFSSGAADVM